MNILITGPPRCGKTTFIKEVIEEIEGRVYGFYTEEMREEGVRIGFSLKTMSGKEIILAHINIKGDYRVGKYGVDVERFSEIAPSEIKEGIKRGAVIVIDEIGKMEVFSEEFKEALLLALDRGRTIATISERGDRFISQIKERKDVLLFNLNKDKKEMIKSQCLKL
jgi:nucleoside-triphosphatase